MQAFHEAQQPRRDPTDPSNGELVL
jgi:hypothetical protein